MQKGQARKNIRPEKIRNSAYDISRVSREVLKRRSISERLRNLPRFKRVVVDFHSLEVGHAGEEVGGDGGEAVVGGDEDLKVGKSVKGRKRT